MKLDGVHIFVDERGIVEEVGDLAVTVDIRTAPVVTVRGFSDAQDALRICAKEPTRVEEGVHALWFEAGQMLMKRADGHVTAADGRHVNEQFDSIIATHDVLIGASAELVAENEKLRQEVASLKTRIENTKSRNKRLEARLDEALGKNAAKTA